MYNKNALLLQFTVRVLVNLVANKAKVVRMHIQLPILLPMKFTRFAQSNWSVSQFHYVIPFIV